jgi:hypothetical protein
VQSGVTGDVEPGDLIRWRGQVWLVRKVDVGLATAVVEAERNMEVIASDADSTPECEVWCKPAQQWPSAALPFRARSSRLVSVQRAGATLNRFVDWVKLDDFQIGGALYLNPQLRLAYGDRLTVIFSDPAGSLMTLPIDIPRNFLPSRERRPSVPISQVVLEEPPTAKQRPGLFARLKGKE